MSLQIWIVWTEAGQEIAKRRRDDLGERHVFRDVLIPKAARFIEEGSAEHLAKAEAYAAKHCEPGAFVLSFSSPRAQSEVLAEVLKKARSDKR